ncbi:MAG: hypothetical protein ACLFM7_10950 [Bacteroidales bacterium]
MTHFVWNRLKLSRNLPKKESMSTIPINLMRNDSPPFNKEEPVLPVREEDGGESAP